MNLLMDFLKVFKYSTHSCHFYKKIMVPEPQNIQSKARIRPGFLRSSCLFLFIYTAVYNCTVLWSHGKSIFFK